MIALTFLDSEYETVRMNDVARLTLRNVCRLCCNVSGVGHPNRVWRNAKTKDTGEEIEASEGEPIAEADGRTTSVRVVRKVDRMTTRARPTPNTMFTGDQFVVNRPSAFAKPVQPGDSNNAPPPRRNVCRPLPVIPSTSAKRGKFDIPIDPTTSTAVDKVVGMIEEPSVENFMATGKK